MMVFADMQCPFCAEFENKAMPEIVKRYVRTGKLKLVFQPIAILGDDSVTGARGVAAAAQQNKLFEYAALVYRNQGEEGSGYLDDAYVKQVAGATPGLDTAKFTADLKSAAVDKLMTDAQSIATSGKVESTPSFFVSKAGATLEPLQVTELTPEAFTSQLDKLTS
jgi:protein-disulfide isomerase